MSSENSNVNDVLLDVEQEFLLSRIKRIGHRNDCMTKLNLGCACNCGYDEILHILTFGTRKQVGKAKQLLLERVS